MVTKSAVAFVLGASIVLVPAFVYELFGASLQPGGLFAAREYGAAMLGIAAITWFGRHAAEAGTRLGILLGLVVYDAVGVMATVVAITSGALAPLAWLIVALYAFFTLGFGYVLAGGGQPARTRGPA